MPDALWDETEVDAQILGEVNDLFSPRGLNLGNEGLREELFVEVEDLSPCSQTLQSYLELSLKFGVRNHIGRN